MVQRWKRCIAFYNARLYWDRRRGLERKTTRVHGRAQPLSRVSSCLLATRIMGWNSNRSVRKISGRKLRGVGLCSDSRRIGGGMAGRSGGALILAGNGWVARPMEMPLTLEAPKVHWSYARVESRSTGEVVRCLAYYGHPLDRARTLRDTHVVDELETTDTAPLVVMGDLNIDDTYHEMHLTRLGDVGLRWAFQKGTDPEPTFTNNGVSTRIDRVWVSYSLLQSLLLFSVEDTFLVPGHRAVWTYYEARSDAVWTSHAAPPHRCAGNSKRSFVGKGSGGDVECLRLTAAYCG